MKKIFFSNFLILGVIIYLLVLKFQLFYLYFNENIFINNSVFVLFYSLLFLLVLFSLLRNYKYVFSGYQDGDKKPLKRFRLFTLFCAICTFLLFIFSLLAPITKYNYIQSDFTFSPEEPRGLRDPFFVKELRLIVKNPYPEVSESNFNTLMNHCRRINSLEEPDKYCTRSIICSFSYCGSNLDCASVCTFILPNKSKK
jgi:hypothetical protein